MLIESMQVALGRYGVIHAPQLGNGQRATGYMASLGIVLDWLEAVYDIASLDFRGKDAGLPAPHGMASMPQWRADLAVWRPALLRLLACAERWEGGATRLFIVVPYMTAAPVRPNLRVVKHLVAETPINDMLRETMERRPVWMTH